MKIEIVKGKDSASILKSFPIAFNYFRIVQPPESINDRSSIIEYNNYMEPMSPLEIPGKFNQFFFLISNLYLIKQSIFFIWMYARHF